MSDDRFWMDVGQRCRLSRKGAEEVASLLEAMEELPDKVDKDMCVEVGQDRLALCSDMFTSSCARFLEHLLGQCSAQRGIIVYYCNGNDDGMLMMLLLLIQISTLPVGYGSYCWR